MTALLVLVVASLATPAPAAAPTPAAAPQPEATPAPEAHPDAPEAPPRSRFDFAERLWGQQDYYRAIGAFKEAIFFAPEDPRVPEARLKIALSYRRGRQWNHALAAFQEVEHLHQGSPVAWRARLQAAYTQLQVRAARLARDTLEPLVAADAAPPEVRAQAAYLLAATHVYDRDWSAASAAFGELAASSAESAPELARSAKLLAPMARRGEELSYKSPALAGVLAIIPGLGHLYAGRYMDAFEALLFCGGFGFLTAYAVVADLGVPLIATSGSFFGLFYLANIYGAVNDARQANRLIDANFENDLLTAAQLEQHFEVVPPATPGITLLRLQF